MFFLDVGAGSRTEVNYWFPDHRVNEQRTVRVICHADGVELSHPCGKRSAPTVPVAGQRFVKRRYSQLSSVARSYA
jgi:hypothetical protein